MRPEARSKDEAMRQVKDMRPEARLKDEATRQPEDMYEARSYAEG
jgi:hypothetical protein